MSGAEELSPLEPPIETPGLKRPKLETNRGKFYEKSIERGDFWIIEHDKKGPDGRKLPLSWNIIEKLGPTLKSGQLDGGVEEYPWDTIVLMTTKWLIVARPEPQSEPEKAEAQGAAIWKEALRKIGADESQTIAICWFLVADPSVIPNKNLNLLPTEKRVELYTKKIDEGMSAVPWIKHKICKTENYIFDRIFPCIAPLDPHRPFIKRNITVIHGKDTCSSSIIPDNDYLDLGFLPITMGWDHVKLHVAREPLKCYLPSDNMKGKA